MILLFIPVNSSSSSTLIANPKSDTLTIPLASNNIFSGYYNITNPLLIYKWLCLESRGNGYHKLYMQFIYWSHPQPNPLIYSYTDVGLKRYRLSRHFVLYNHTPLYLYELHRDYAYARQHLIFDALLI